MGTSKYSFTVSTKARNTHSSGLPIKYQHYCNSSNRQQSTVYQEDTRYLNYDIIMQI